ncbi:MAG TPA: ATP-binding protein [Patescibacteria group bacterium]|nr:ATP-binding protein [Patescibacteria group bacterium]
MSYKFRGKFSHLNRSLLAFAILVLGVYLYYTLSFIGLTPYPGIVFTAISGGWQVNDSSLASVAVDEVLVQIADLTYADYRLNPFSVPFDGYTPGDAVPDVITESGETLSLVMPIPSFQDRLRRLVGTLWFFPFWMAGTAVLLFLRPRDLSWRLLIAFMYLAATWALVGSIANWQVGASTIVSILVAWLMVPCVIHLHLTVPSPIFVSFTRRIMPLIYIGSIAIAIIEITQSSDRLSISLLALALAVMYSILILAYRSFRKGAPISDRNSARLMLSGIGLAFGPGILVITLPQVSALSVPPGFGVSLAFISLPIFPISYTYAIYKRQLGQLEFRANRLLGIYSFILLYPTIFIVVLLLGEQWLVTSSTKTFYLLFVSIIFVMATPPILNFLQKTMNRLAYGTEHDPDDILRVFAKNIPLAKSRAALSDSLNRDILPALLIRQSALSLFDSDGVELIYADGISQSAVPSTSDELEKLGLAARAYRPPATENIMDHDWVRLAIPLITPEKAIGVWLFGRRDPDDFYPQNDIDLLHSLANQMAPVIENVRLYEELQRHANDLTEEVANRTSELRAEKDRTQAILDSAGEGVFFTDPAGVILYANQALAHQSGFTADDLIGKTLELWQTEEDAHDSYRDMWTAIYTGHEWGGEMLLHRKDNTYCDVNLVMAPILSEGGKLSGFVGVQSDISKLKEVDRLKSNIISSVSHELKTPLTTIKTYLMLIQRGKPEKKDSYMVVLNREADRLAIIIEDLLDLSSLETGKIPSRLEPMDLLSTVGIAITSCQTLANTKQISINSAINGALPMAIADSSQMEQVLMNLIVNALNYSFHGSSVTIRTGEGSLNSHEGVWVRVSDNGPGISEGDLPHLFDRFYRGEAALESGAPGTGLGLAICKEIIDRHQGKIEVESKPGGGAAFTVWLPALKPAKMEHDLLTPKPAVKSVDTTD